MTPDTGLDDATVRRIERFIDARRVRHDVPGLSVAITDPDGTVYGNAFGARDIEENTPVTPDTLYGIASVTKLYTALAVLRLASRGELSLDDEIRAYTEFWSDVPGAPITVAELLSHSSGVPDDSGHERELLFGDTLPANPMVTPEDTMVHTNAAAAEQRYTGERGEYMYNTRGYQILGAVVETVSERPFDAFVEEELFDPLGMGDSRVGHGELADEPGDVARGYRFEDGEPVPSSYDLHGETHPPYSGGGVLSSATEMARTARCLLNDGAVAGDQLVDAELVEAMCSPQSPSVGSIEGASDHAYGFGPRLMELLGEPLAYHTGTAPGASRAYLGVLRASGVGVALGANTADVPIGAIGKGVTALLDGESPASAVPKLGIERKVRAVTGTYEGFRGAGGMTVTAGGNDSHVLLSPGGRDRELPAVPETADPEDLTFVLQGQHGRRFQVAFRETADGLEFRFGSQRLTRAT